MPPNDGMTPPASPRRPSSASDFPRTGPFSLAAPGPRHAARAIDLVLVAFPALVYIAFSTRYVQGSFEFDAPLWFPPAVFAIGSLYEFLGVVLWGRTPGKWMFGLKVVRMVDGRRPTVSQALLRAMAPWSIIALPLGVFSLPGLLIAYGSANNGELHRGLADHAGGTVVISTR